jgi:hypothetical protein
MELPRWLRWERKRQGLRSALFAPSHDKATRKTAAWARDFDSGGLSKRIGRDATAKNARDFVASSPHLKILLFLGHGRSFGLITEAGLGKRSSFEEEIGDACLMDCADLDADVQNLHCVAWSCWSGLEFGEKYKSQQMCGFLGFVDILSFTINRAESEYLWRGMIFSTFREVLDQNGVLPHHAATLRKRLLDARRDIIAGRLNTGVHNKFNRMCLRHAAQSVRAYVREGGANVPYD